MADYFLGHSQAELDRLETQAVILRPITERLLLKAGLRPGTRVLDLGCGAGDVSLLAAERVGPGGSVIGIDIGPKAIELARHRAAERGFDHIAFYLADDPEHTEAEPFDFVIGRCVIVHQEDPADFIRAAAARLRPGGIIAFHEADMCSGFATLPPAPYFDATVEAMMETVRNGIPQPDAAARLLSLFLEAGLPAPKLFCERPAGGDEDSLLFRWCATAHVAIHALTHPGEPPLSADSIEHDLRQSVTCVNGQVLGPDQVCAWTRI